MNSISDYIIWLQDSEEKAPEKRTKQSIRRLISLLLLLEEKRILDNHPLKIFKQMEIMRHKVELNPAKTRRVIETCIKNITKITASSYKFVPPGYYIDQWLWLSGGICTAIGIYVYTATHNALFLILGLLIGWSLGWAIGYLLDKKAKNENRVLAFE